MPSSLSSAPIGIWTGIGTAPVRSLIIRTQLKKSAPGLVHLVDEHDPRNLVAVGLPPDRFGLRLHTRIAVKQHDGTVKHGQRAFHLDGEIDVTGGIDDVEAVFDRSFAVSARIDGALPEGRGRGRGDRDATRSCSCSIQSIVAAPSCTSPILWDLPV